MELSEYLTVRRAHNLIRQDLSAQERLTFCELAILCRIHLLKRPVNTSAIAEYQGALRPTMTHRTKHLASLGFITREKGVHDRRNVSCDITEAGVAYVSATCKEMGDQLRKTSSFERLSPRRMECLIEGMGAIACMSADLVLLGIMAAQSENAGRVVSVSDLVRSLGLLQPTVSMSVSSLAKSGLVMREGDSHAAGIELTDEGRARAEEMRAQIEGITIRR